MESKYFYSSLLAAHSNSTADGFRQKEVRFYMEQFSSWVFVKINASPFPLHNTQIMRSLESMVRLGLAKKLERKNPPRYKLTRAGLLKALNKFVELPLSDSYSDFFFVYQFIVTYKAKLLDQMRKDPKNFSKSKILDVEFLLDEKKFRRTQLELVELEIRYMKEQIRESTNIQFLGETPVAGLNRLHLFWKPKLQHLECFEQILKSFDRPKSQKN